MRTYGGSRGASAKRRPLAPVAPSALAVPALRLGAPALPTSPLLRSGKRAASGKRGAAPRPQGSRKVQRVLDFGQRSLGRRQECSACGMLYVVGDLEDEAVHRKMCAAQMQGVVFAGCEKEGAGGGVGNGVRVVEVRPGDAARLWNKVKEVLRVAGQAMDLCIRGLIDGEGCPETDEEGETAEKPCGHTAFLAVRGQRVVGVCVTRPVEAAEVTWIRPDGNDGMLATHEAFAETGGVGVEVIWTHPSTRRQGLATQLLEAARQRSVFGRVCPREELAFSQPTAEGLQLASGYQRRSAGGRVAVYGGEVLG